MAPVYGSSRRPGPSGPWSILRPGPRSALSPELLWAPLSPLDNTELAALIARSGLPVRDFLRRKEALYNELQLDTQDDKALLDALAAHPQLFTRPVASSEQGVRIGRPAERVLELLEEEK